MAHPSDTTKTCPLCGRSFVLQVEGRYSKLVNQDTAYCGLACVLRIERASGVQGKQPVCHRCKAPIDIAVYSWNGSGEVYCSHYCDEADEGIAVERRRVWDARANPKPRKHAKGNWRAIHIANPRKPFRLLKGGGRTYMTFCEQWEPPHDLGSITAVREATCTTCTAKATARLEAST